VSALDPFQPLAFSIRGTSRVSTPRHATLTCGASDRLRIVCCGQFGIRDVRSCRTTACRIRDFTVAFDCVTSQQRLPIVKLGHCLYPFTPLPIYELEESAQSHFLRSRKRQKDQYCVDRKSCEKSLTGFIEIGDLGDLGRISAGSRRPAGRSAGLPRGLRETDYREDLRTMSLICSSSSGNAASIALIRNPLSPVLW